MEYLSSARESIEARSVSGLSQNGDLERPLCEAMKVKPGFLWRPQDADNTRVMACLLGRANKQGG